MEAILARLIGQLNSSVFMLLGILLVAFWAVYRLGLLVAKFTQQDLKIAALDNLAEKVVVLATKVDLIYQNTNPNKVVAAMSPISLTKVGTEIATKINADALLARHLVNLKKEVELVQPKNAYDIQMAAMKATREKLITLLNETELIAVKAEAYARGLIVEDVLSVIGVLLRNHILKEKGIPISDVDKHEKKPV